MDITIVPGTNYSPRVGFVHPATVVNVWPVLSEIIKEHPRGLLEGLWTLDEVFVAIAVNRFDVWLGLDEDLQTIEAAALCRLETYSEFKLYRVVWVGGKVRPILHEAREKIEAYARDVLGADKLAFDTRKGMTRLLAKKGYEIVYYEMWKTLPRSN